MKNKTLLIFALLSALAVLSAAPSGALAAEENFAAGSLIIPMESVYQPENDDRAIFKADAQHYLDLRNQLSRIKQKALHKNLWVKYSLGT